MKLSDICARLTVARSDIARILELSCLRPAFGDEEHPSTDELIDIALLSVDAAIEALTEAASVRRLDSANPATQGRPH